MCLMIHILSMFINYLKTLFLFYNFVLLCLTKSNASLINLRINETMNNVKYENQNKNNNIKSLTNIYHNQNL